MFRTQYDRERVTTEPGNPIKEIYAGKLDKLGNLVVEKKGEKNLYAEINSWADSVDINVLLARFANGDKNALIQRAADFIDISNIPNNIADLLNLVNDGRKFFDSLPIDVKKAFDNNFNKFITSVDSQEWYDIMTKSPDDINKEKVMKSKAVAEINSDIAAGKEILENPGVDIQPVKPEVPEVEVKRSIRR